MKRKESQPESTSSTKKAKAIFYYSHKYFQETSEAYYKNRYSKQLRGTFQKLSLFYTLLFEKSSQFARNIAMEQLEALGVDYNNVHDAETDEVYTNNGQQFSIVPIDCTVIDYNSNISDDLNNFIDDEEDEKIKNSFGFSKELFNKIIQEDKKINAIYRLKETKFPALVNQEFKNLIKLRVDPKKITIEGRPLLYYILDKYINPSPHHNNAREFYIPTVQAFFCRLDLNQRYQGNTPLTYVLQFIPEKASQVSKEEFPTLILLHEQRPYINEKKLFTSLSIIKLLVERGVDINIADDKGNTLLHCMLFNIDAAGLLHYSDATNETHKRLTNIIDLSLKTVSYDNLLSIINSVTEFRRKYVKQEIIPGIKGIDGFLKAANRQMQNLLTESLDKIFSGTNTTGIEQVTPEISTYLYTTTPTQKTNRVDNSISSSSSDNTQERTGYDRLARLRPPNNPNFTPQGQSLDDTVSYPEHSSSSCCSSSAAPSIVHHNDNENKQHEKEEKKRVEELSSSSKYTKEKERKGC